MFSSQEFNDLYFMSKLKTIITMKGIEIGIENKKLEEP
jgi:hypothetical protein